MTKQQCPLCGKPVEPHKSLCEECQNFSDHQYDTTFLDTEEHINDSTLEEDILLTDNNIQLQKESQKKKKTSKNIICFLVGCLLVTILGVFSGINIKKNRLSAENEEQFWNNCVIENTPLAYSKYLISFQNGKYVEEANRRIEAYRSIEEKKWIELQKSNDINDYYDYIIENPDTPHLNQIKLFIDSLAWITTTKLNTSDAYKAYLENIKLGNIIGKYQQTALDKYRYFSQVKFVEDESLDSLKSSLKNIFHILSNNDSKEMLNLFEPQVSFFNEKMSNTDAIKKITKDVMDKKIHNIVYTIDDGSVLAQKDSLNLFFIHLVVTKNINYTTKMAKEKKGDEKKETISDSLYLILSPDLKIKHFSKNKDF